MALYNIGIYLYVAAVRLASLFNRKAKLWVSGRKGGLKRLKEQFSEIEGSVIWVHAASLGEFEQGRPIIERIRREFPDKKILLTFFSPSGYEIRKNYDGADYISYLPADTKRNARRFLEVVKPEVAIFIKYEFWLNYLNRLKQVGCRTFVVSAIFHPEAVFFKKRRGKIFRRGLSCFEHLYVQDEQSEKLLAGIGIENASIVGDTRFDRVVSVVEAAQDLPLVARFVEDSDKVMVAGSTWPPDEEILKGLIRSRRDMKFIIAPHEIDQGRIDELIEWLDGEGVRYMNCDGETDFSDKRVMVVDTIGILSAVYRYGDLGYIGGGFGVGIHNTLEAAAYGLPLIFGPNYKKFAEACQLIEIGAAESVNSLDDADRWIRELLSDTERYKQMQQIAREFVYRNKGATDRIVSEILG